MNPGRFAAMALIGVMLAIPARANEGGGGKGDAAQRQSQQQREETQTGPASAAAREFYAGVVAGIDAAIAAKRAEIAEWEKDIAATDHRMARDFEAARADDKTTEDMLQSAKKALELRGTKRAQDVAAAGYLDPGAADATIMICIFEAKVEELKSLEAARTNMVEAARGLGATID